MIASQVNLDHRLAELRHAGVDSRVDKARSAGQPDGARGLIDSIRALLGSSPAARRTVGLAAR
jgi:hypothetical protein